MGFRFRRRVKLFLGQGTRSSPPSWLLIMLVVVVLVYAFMHD